ncbi:CxxC motif-containing protein [Ruminiclostridium sufflavum DSM 19573]|uniref:CxxC motif-containing protein n=1 Tax=Ruminiclostridium sufflavum DSM 19573 TaxID=1121337 RepID=A0A318Y2Y3_9FIRM|nr:DUF1667 domain-containing protein [Ruminiclostridium sufflavum]PYG89857.1 CxxC motif-containing protein [Ruminiclostridium sufflavum DSM 19573]
MDDSREIVCIVCPNGCRMNVVINHDNNKVEMVENALCEKGKAYARDEIQCPKRSLTSTVKVIDGVLPLVSVRSDKPLPKEKIREAAVELRKIELQAPIIYHQVIVSNLLGTGANIIATKEVSKR